MTSRSSEPGDEDVLEPQRVLDALDVHARAGRRRPCPTRPSPRPRGELPPGARGRTPAPRTGGRAAAPATIAPVDAPRGPRSRAAARRPPRDDRACPTTGLDPASPKNVPVPGDRKLHDVYLPMRPAPAAKTRLAHRLDVLGRHEGHELEAGASPPVDGAQRRRGRACRSRPRGRRWCPRGRRRARCAGSRRRAPRARPRRRPTPARSRFCASKMGGWYATIASQPRPATPRSRTCARAVDGQENARRAAPPGRRPAGRRCPSDAANRVGAMASIAPTRSETSCPARLRHRTAPSAYSGAGFGRGGGAASPSAALDRRVDAHAVEGAPHEEEHDRRRRPRR